MCASRLCTWNNSRNRVFFFFSRVSGRHRCGSEAACLTGPPLAIRIPGSGVLASGLLRRLWCSHGWGFGEPLARTVPLLKAPAWGVLSPARRAEVWVSDGGLGRRQSWVGVLPSLLVSPRPGGHSTSLSYCKGEHIVPVFPPRVHSCPEDLEVASILPT